MAPENEFDVTAANWLARAYYTPVSDALRGQLSARLDIRRDIAAANLPLPLSKLIYSVCRRTRLWRGEKSDVARELIAHFSDGLAAGRAADELAKDFGPVEQSARLIRRAKLRNRPLWWRSCRFGIRLVLATLGLILLVYSVLAARFYLGKPEVAHNYWHEINAARRVDESDRAWPLYREGIFKLGKDQMDRDWMAEGPTGKAWNKAIEMLDRHPESLTLFREGAKKPHLGLLLGDPSDRDAELATGQDSIFSKQSADDNEELIQALLPAIQELRRVARFLQADALYAANKGDGSAALADLTALVSLSEQAFQPDACLVEQLFGIAIFGLATDAANRILTESPQVFSDTQLRDLAHRIAAYRGGAMSLDFGMERMMFDDLLQRAFTDDGHGNGRITPDGINTVIGLLGGPRSVEHLLSPYNFQGAPAVLAKVIGPGVATQVGSRKENSDVYHTVLDEMIEAHQGPPWLWDKADGKIVERHNLGSSQGPLARVRYWLPSLILPSIDPVFSAAERTIQVRDATEVAIALTLWKRRHGQWPERLDQLVPELLPAVPPDRADGKPLRYVVRDGKAVVYSIGADRDDDGGRSTADPTSAVVASFGPISAEEQKRSNGSDHDGDWILWPPVKIKRAETQD